MTLRKASQLESPQPSAGCQGPPFRYLIPPPRQHSAGGEVFESYQDRGETVMDYVTDRIVELLLPNSVCQ